MVLCVSYGFPCDIFSCAVVFFLMMTGGSPPFKVAKTDDKLFRALAANRPDKFWSKRKKCSTYFTDHSKKLFEEMSQYQPSRRYTIEKILNDPWMKYDSVKICYSYIF